MAEPRRSLNLVALAAAYADGTKPEDVIGECHAQIARGARNGTWISIASLDRVLTALAAAARRRAAGEHLPLFGVPFAVKDNIDVAGLPTTAACSAFSYMPQRSAAVVEKLEAAGAIVMGKTNLDQFATGLTGTRSPYGTPSSVFDAAYISGGSSSGSAVAVAAGSVSFALGTDTAGSGRVPAAFNNIVGLKPTRGWLSTSGVVPACRSLDCVSIFAGCVGDAMAVARIAQGFDAADPFSRHLPDSLAPIPDEGFRFGVPDAPLDFFGDDEAAALYKESIVRLENLGGIKVPIDFAPFRDAGRLLYGAAWVAERLTGLKPFISNHAGAMLPITRAIVGDAAALSAVDAFEGIYRLATLARAAEAQWAEMDIMLLPTTGTIYRTAEVEADPIRLNSNLGLYTNFANLLDLSAIAIPAGFRRNGLPFGVTLFARAFEDAALAQFADRAHRALDGATIGATGHPLPSPPLEQALDRATVDVAVLGAHLSGEPLNGELIGLGARLMRCARTAPGYSFYALAGGGVARPGLVYDGRGTGRIELEIWAMSAAAFGRFVAGSAPPLAVGTIALDDGGTVKGFLCEAHAVAGAENITGFGGWRAYRR